GTYARKLVSDLGEEIGIGGHMLELRRLKAGPFSENKQEGKNGDEIDGCVNLYDFEKAIEEYKNGDDKKLRDLIIPAEVVSELYPVLELKNNQEKIKQFLTGKPIYLRDIKNAEKLEGLGEGNLVSVFFENRFIGMYKLVNIQENKKQKERQKGDYVNDGEKFFLKPDFVYN
ncbi:MAG: hypothetical protein ACOC1P_04720, partial [Minisyncoccales bacterium]